MRVDFLTTGLLIAGLSLAGCGGGSGGGGTYGVPVPVATSTPSSAPSNPPAAAGDAKQASIGGAPALVDASSGLALYTFDGDTVADQSTCTGGCLAVWPAHAARSSEKASGNFTIFTRTDGSLQWAYKGKPLYTFASDSPGNNGTGDGVQGFHIARP